MQSPRQNGCRPVRSGQHDQAPRCAASKTPDGPCLQRALRGANEEIRGDVPSVLCEARPGSSAERCPAAQKAIHSFSRIPAEEASWRSRPECHLSVTVNLQTQPGDARTKWSGPPGGSRAASKWILKGGAHVAAGHLASPQRVSEAPPIARIKNRPFGRREVARVRFELTTKGL